MRRLVGIRTLGIIAIMVAAEVGAQPADPADTRRPRMVVLSTTKDVAAARREANRAADRLRYSIAPDTLSKPPARRVFVGAVVTLQRTTDGAFAVVSYLGDHSDATKALAEARKYYRDARLVPVVRPRGLTDDWIDTPFARLGILVVGSHGSYDAALRAAKAFAAKSGYPYGSRGMVYDKQRGLIWPDDLDDEAFAGEYAPRRYDNECDITEPKPCVTVERSEAYEGFTPGLYIVVAGVLGRGDDRESRLATARRIVPGAYIKQTTIYLGCMH